MNARIFVLISVAGFSGGAAWLASHAWLLRENHDDDHDPLVRLLLDAKKSSEGTGRKNTIESAHPHLIQFESAAERLGIHFVYFDGAEGQFHLFETMGGGMAVADFDRDGQLDIFFTNGARMPVRPTAESHHAHLYLRRPAPTGNEAECWEASIPAGVDVRFHGQGCAAADFDNDGFEDLLVLGVQHLVLFRNQGDGTFVQQRHDSDPHWWSTGVWCDFDADGDLDCYVCAYADFDWERPIRCEAMGRRGYCVPLRYSPQSDVVLENLGNGQFRDITQECGANERTGRGLGIAAADFTGDGKPDLYVANDMSEAFFWVNQSGPSIRLANQALDRGVSLSGKGTAMSGMGVAVADFDRNGWLDLGVSDFYEAGVSLFANQGSKGFVHAGHQAKLTSPTRSKLGFGCAFLDADLDGYPDFIVTNGHISDYSRAGLPYKMPTQLLHNKQGKEFSEISLQAGEYFRQNRLGRGLALGDFNNDGRVDVTISNIRDPAALLINRTNNAGHWIGCDLIGVISNRDARNVRIQVRTSSGPFQHETIAGGGYYSSSDTRLVIGLGQAPMVDALEISWPSGRIQTILRPAVDQYHVIREPTDPRGP